jgi:tetratricopeptide (TPR) repeat protein
MNNFHLGRAKLFLAAAQLLARPPYSISLSFSSQGNNYYVDEITDGSELFRLWKGVGFNDFNRWAIIFEQLVKLILEGKINPKTNFYLNAIYTGQFAITDKVAVERAILKSFRTFIERPICPEQAAIYIFAAYELSDQRIAEARLFFLLAAPRYIEDGDWRKAAKVIRRGAEISEPKQALELFELAGCWFTQAECFREAASCLEKAAKLAQGREALLLFLDAAEQHKRGDNIARVKICFKLALKNATRKEQEKLLPIIADYYLEVGELNLALKIYARAAHLLEKQGNPRGASLYWQKIAEQREKTQEYRAAGYAYEEAAKLLVNEEAYACWIKAAENYNLGGRPEVAAFCYEKAATVISDIPRMKIALQKGVEKYQAAGKPQDAVALLVKLAQLSEDEERAAYFVSAANLVDDCRKEIEFRTLAIGLLQERAALIEREKIALAQSRDGNHRSAAGEFEQIGRIYETEGKPDQALRCYQLLLCERIILQKYQKVFETYLKCIEILQQISGPEAALETINKAVRFLSDHQQPELAARICLIKVKLIDALDEKQTTLQEAARLFGTANEHVLAGKAYLRAAELCREIEYKRELLKCALEEYLLSGRKTDDQFIIDLRQRIKHLSNSLLSKLK